MSLDNGRRVHVKCFGQKEKVAETESRDAWDVLRFSVCTSDGSRD